jgi:uncharacterized protein
MKPGPNIPKNTLTTGELRINISKLSEGIHDYQLSTLSKNIGLDERFNDSVRVDVDIDKSSNQFYLKVKIDTNGNFECDRCLEKFEMHLDTSYEMAYMYRQVSDLEEISDDVHIINPEMNHIDISEDVREYTMLAVPIKILCSDDCAGLCPGCGTNLNKNKCTCDIEDSDNRWEPLSKLLKSTK